MTQDARLIQGREADRTTVDTREGAPWVEAPRQQATIEELRAEVRRLRQLEPAAIEFRERCERGAVRGQYTYRRFRAALDGV